MQSELTEKQAREDLVEVSRLCYTRGYISGTEGNFSIRLAENLVLTTPAGSCKGRLRTSDLVLTDISGNSLSDQKPSTELKMHLVAYETRPDVKAVVHAHPTVAVGFTVAGASLEQCVLPEVVCTLGRIPTAPYATPSTNEIPDSIRPLIALHDAIMLDHHGALTIGKDIFDAFYKLETVEHFAQTMLVAHMLGGPKALYASQVQKLIDICGTYGLRPPAEADKLVTAGFCRQDPEI